LHISTGWPRPSTGRVPRHGEATWLRQTHEPGGDLVELSTRFLMPVPLPRGDHADLVTDALATRLPLYPQH
jgi:hypothetical protein